VFSGKISRTKGHIQFCNFTHFGLHKQAETPNLLRFLNRFLPAHTHVISLFMQKINTVAPFPAIEITSKLPTVGTTIFTVMTRMAIEYGAISLSQGAPDFPCSDELIDLITHYMKAGFNQYAPMEGLMALREQIALKTERCYGYAPDPLSEVTVVTGATEGLFAAITAVVHPGDEVIVLEPCYDSYIPAIELCGGKAIRISLETDTYRIPWQQLANAINSRTRLLIINTPHNPTGTILRKEDIQQLGALLKDTQILLISDEVYEHIIFDGEPHYSVLREPELRERSFVMSSFGKTYHATGWKMGYCIAPAFLTRELRRVHQFVVFSTHTPTQYALADYLKKPETYEDLPAFFQQKRDKFRQMMSQTRFRLLPSEGSYFQLASYAHMTDEGDANYATRLTKDYGVATIPVSAFYKEGTDNKILRFCFAKKDQTLEKAVERLAKV
jgi:methionine transaminase